MAIFGHFGMNPILPIDPSKLCTSQGHNKPKISKVGQFLVAEMGNLLFTLYVQTPCTLLNGLFKWIEIQFL